MTDIPDFDSVNSVKYLYLRELSEPRDNALRIVVEEAVVNQAATAPVWSELPDLEKILKGSSPIESTEGCKCFELLWKRYVAYLVTEECVGSCGHDDEVYTGALLRVYTKSHFLEHLARNTGGHFEPIKHFKLICLNHLIDIASYSRPEIRLLNQQKSTTPTAGTIH
jgi:hypothetical protein